MLRLAHRILLKPPSAMGTPELRDEIRIAMRDDIQKIKTATIIIADNVFEYQQGMDGSDMVDAGFHSIRLPISPLWIEWQSEFQTKASDDMSPIQLGAFQQMGCLLQSLPLDVLSESDQAKGIIPQGCSLWIEQRGEAVYLGSRVIVGVNAAGELAGWSVFRKGALGTDLDVMKSLLTAFLTLAFMHCKNVARIDATESEGPSPKWLRRQKQPTLRYHVLQIDPMKEVLRKEGGSETNGLKKALHICRGHFATFSEEKPLFGKLAGTFWRPSHVRGSLDQGVVVKDYQINPGKG